MSSTTGSRRPANSSSPGDSATATGTDERAATTVYTDGACSGNPGPGGWAWAIPGGGWASGAATHTTNQRMEIQAVLEAVRAIDGPLDIVSDSTYVVNCFRDRWWEGWLRRGWVNSQKKPVANRDLWEPLIDAYRGSPARLRFRWVKGHSGDQMNDVVDRLAVAAAARQESARGDSPPTDLGPADAPTRPASKKPTANASGSGVEPPSGHRLVVAGVRPPALGGYDDPPAASYVRERLTEILAAKAQIEPDLIVLTGLGLGSEQLGAQAAAAAGIDYVAVLAFPEQDRLWGAEARARFARLLDAAADTITLQSSPPATKQAAGGALARRDAWLARHAHEAVVVWDGDDHSVGRTVRSLRDHLGEEQVWVLEPPAPGGLFLP